MRSSPNCSRVLPRAAAAQAVLAAAGCRPSARHPPCGSPSLQGGQGRQLQLKYDYVGINGNRLASGAHVLIDGMNTEGLFATVQYQSNNTFHAAYDPAGPADALPLVDLVPFALGSFGSVAKVREYLNPAKLQLTTGCTTRTLQRSCRCDAWQRAACRARSPAGPAQRHPGRPAVPLAGHRGRGPRRHAAGCRRHVFNSLSHCLLRRERRRPDPRGAAGRWLCHLQLHRHGEALCEAWRWRWRWRRRWCQ